MNNEASFAVFWSREFPGSACPPMPRNLDELNLTAQMTMRSSAPELYTAMFAGTSDVRLPADVSVRLNSGQLQNGDAGALRSAGFEVQAQQCERLGQAQQDQKMADEIARSRAVYEQEMQRSEQWSQMGILQRIGHEPLTSEQISANRRRYGISG